MSKQLPSGVQTQRADGSVWQKPASPDAKNWKQIKDGDKPPQSEARPAQVEGVGGAADANTLGNRLLASKYDLDGFSPSDAIHPSHVSVDTDGDMDGKAVATWDDEEGNANRSYSKNFHQRKHRHTFAAMQQNKVALSYAPSELLRLYNEAPDGDKDRYLAAHIVAEHGHSVEQVLSIQRGHVGTSVRKGRGGLPILLNHASGRQFTWESKSPELKAHVTARSSQSPTGPLFHCGPDCISSALSEVGLGDVPVPTIRAHAQAKMAVDLLSKTKRVRIDSMGSGIDKVRGSIAEASQVMAEFYGHRQSPADMSYVPPHVQASFLESCGGGSIFKNTFGALNKGAVHTPQEESLWQHAEDQVLKSVPKEIPQGEIPRLVRTLYEKLVLNPTSIQLSQSSTPLGKGATTTSTTPPASSTEEATSATTVETLETEKFLPQSTPQTMLGTPSQPPTPQSASPEPSPTSTSTTTRSQPQGLPTEGLTSTQNPSDTPGLNQDLPWCSTTGTSTPKQAMSTPSFRHSNSLAASDVRAGCAPLYAQLLLKGVSGLIAPSGIQFFTEVFTAVKDEETTALFLAEVTTFISEVASFQKSGSVAGTRGDPLGQVAVHGDGSRWRKVGNGQWERVGGTGKKKKQPEKQKQTTSARVQALRQRLKQLRASWKSASSTTQRAQVVKNLTAVKMSIRQTLASKVAKSLSAEVDDELGALDVIVTTHLSAWQQVVAESEAADVQAAVVPEVIVKSYMSVTHMRRDDTVCTAAISSYIRETDHYDIRKVLTPSDYIQRAVADGGPPATELKTMLIMKGYAATLTTLASIMQEVRNGTT